MSELVTTSPRVTPKAGPTGGGALVAALSGVYTMWYRDILRFSRDRSRLIGSLGQPILFLFVFGAGLSPAVGQLGQGTGAIGYIQFMFPGIIAMAVLFTAIFAAISIVWDREFGFLKEVLVAPIPRWAVALGKTLGGSTTAMFQGVVILLFAPIAGVALTPLTVIELLPLMFITAIALSSLGLFIAARMKSFEGFQVIMNFLMLPMFFLSGALFPLTNLPEWLGILTKINPVTYGVDAIRTIVLSQAGVPTETIQALGPELFGRRLDPVLDMAIVALFAAAMIGLAVRQFNVQE